MLDGSRIEVGYKKVERGVFAGSYFGKVYVYENDRFLYSLTIRVARLTPQDALHDARQEVAEMQPLTTTAV